MKLLLYGGTFDPPHNGHMNNLRAAICRVAPDRVIVMPAGVPPHKQASATPAAMRLEMCSCFMELADEAELACKNIEVSDWEIRQAEAGKRNYTVLTLEMLAAAQPDAELYLAVGSDMLRSFPQWYRWQDILKLAKLVVVSREIGDDPALHCEAKALDPSGSRILLAPVTAMPLASSELRRRLAAGENCSDSLPEQAQRVICREGLYLGNAWEVDENGTKRGKGPCPPPDGGQAV